jgi:hypothetical protein
MKHIVSGSRVSVSAGKRAASPATKDDATASDDDATAVAMLATLKTTSKGRFVTRAQVGAVSYVPVGSTHNARTKHHPAGTLKEPMSALPRHSTAGRKASISTVPERLAGSSQGPTNNRWDLAVGRFAPPRRSLRRVGGGGNPPRSAPGPPARRAAPPPRRSCGIIRHTSWGWNPARC